MIKEMKNTTILALVFGFQLAILHVIATKLSLYWEISWFDNLMHLFGGVVLVLCIYTLVDIRILTKKWVNSCLRVSLLVLTVLLGWELAGVLMIGRLKENFVIDTTTDLGFGIMGSIAGWFIARTLTKLAQ